MELLKIIVLLTLIVNAFTASEVTTQPMEISGPTHLWAKVSINAKFIVLNRYVGYVAKIGDNVSITCQTDGLPSALTHRATTAHMGQATPNNERITKVETAEWINMTIREVKGDDSGSYSCNSDHKELRVIDPGKPLAMVNRLCYSERFYNLICRFETNAQKSDLVSWSVTYSTRSKRHCFSGSCHNLTCDTTNISTTKRGGKEYSVVECFIRTSNRIFVDAIYDWNITAKNPYVQESSLTSMKLSASMLSLGPPTVLTNTATENSISVKVELYEEDMISASFGLLGPVETAVLGQGITYRVIVQSLQPGIEEVTLLYTKWNTTNWLHIPNLNSSTPYTLSVSNQIAQSLLNRNIWSISTNFSTSTQPAGQAVKDVAKPTDTGELLAPNRYTKLTMTAVYVKESGYVGYEARVGDTLTVHCRMEQSDRPRDVMFKPNSTLQYSEVNAGNRVTRLEDSDWINMTIHGVQMSDAGVYMCSENEINLRVDQAGADNSSGYDLEFSYESTTIVQDMILGAKLTMSANYAIRTKQAYSSFVHYAGYVAVAGDTVKVYCRLDDYWSTLILLKTLSNGTELAIDVGEDQSGRITKVRSEMWLNVTIHGVNVKDSGTYKCSDDLKDLTVINPATQNNPPRVLGYECKSYRVDNYVCLFDTNTVSTDIVNWDVTYSTRKTRNCLTGLCIDVKCDRLRIIPGEGASNDTIECSIDSFVFMQMIYDWRIIGMNPFLNHTSTLSTKMSSNIVTLGPPDILNQTMTATSILVNVQLYSKDYYSHDVGYPGYVEHAVILNGIRYKVTLRPLSEGVASNELTRIFTTKGVTNWLEIEDLEPYTTYDISITNQLSNTINTHIWSKSTNLTTSTLHTFPEVGPDRSTYGFSIGQNTKCDPNREVSLYWKGVPEVTGKGNGIIQSYQVYQADARHTTLLNSSTNPTQTYYSLGQPKMSLPGRVRDVKICVSNETTVLDIVPGNAAGIGRAGSSYFIPAQKEVVNMKACNISVEYSTSNNQLTVEWSPLPRSYNYTVFWCKTEFGDHCTGEVDWKTVGAINNFTFTSAADFLRYKFGVSAHSSSGNSSGIIWKECINHVEEDLQPATLTVTLTDLEAIVHVDEKCVKESRRADYYRIKSCRYDAKDGRCLDEESYTTVHLCNPETVISLKKYSKSYAFWVISHAGDTRVKSSVVIERPQQKSIWVATTAIVVPLSIVIMVTILFAVYFKMKRKQVVALKTPKIVQPVDLVLEKADSSVTQYSDEDSDSDSLHYQPYFQTSLPFAPLVTEALFSKDDSSPSERFYENKQNLGDMSCSKLGDMSCSALSDVSCSKHDSSNYQTRMPSQTNDHKSVLSDCSFDTWPDYYLRCVDTDVQELDLSAELFFNSGISRDTKIDLSSFLTSGCSTRAPNDISSGCYKMKAVNRNTTPTRGDYTETKRLLVDVGNGEEDCSPHYSPEVSVGQTTECSPLVPGYKTELEYITGSDCVHGGLSNQPVNEEIGYEPQNDISENSSGDSGYVGRNVLCSDPIQEV